MPEDGVSLSALLYPVRQEGKDGARWVLEVELDRRVSTPLYEGEKTYYYGVYVFDGQKPVAPSEIEYLNPRGIPVMENLIRGDEAGPYKAAVIAAQSVTALPADYSAAISSAAGFAYLGNNLPIRATYPISSGAMLSNLVAIYSHHEARNQHSWTKVVRPQILSRE